MSNTFENKDLKAEYLGSQGKKEGERNKKTLNDLRIKETGGVI